jgi:hypothetical protein
MIVFSKFQTIASVIYCINLDSKEYLVSKHKAGITVSSKQMITIESQRFYQYNKAILETG